MDGADRPVHLYSMYREQKPKPRICLPCCLIVSVVVCLLVGLSCVLTVTRLHSHLLMACRAFELWLICTLFLTLLVSSLIILIFILMDTNSKVRLGSEDDDTEFKTLIDNSELRVPSSRDNSSSIAVCLLCSVRLLVLIFFTVSLVALVGLCVFVLVIYYKYTPAYDGVFHWEAMRAPVKIERENSGVIHISGTYLSDVFYAQGFVHAQERLWDMELMRKVGTGTLSEVLGRDAIGTDKFSRTIGFYASAERDFQQASPRVKAIIESFCAGVNAFILFRDKLPPEYTLFGYSPNPWKPADVLVAFKLLSYRLSENMGYEKTRFQLLQQGVELERIMELFPVLDYAETTVVSREDMNLTHVPQEEVEAIWRRLNDNSGAYRPKRKHTPRTLQNEQQEDPIFERFFGKFDMSRQNGNSNNWVVGGVNTLNNFPLLANDPHNALPAPGMWLLVHLKCEEGQLDVIGASHHALPGVLIGRNQNITWAVTNSGADVQDLFVMQEASDGKSYRYKDQQVDYRIRSETINVRNSHSETLYVKESIYGPVVNDVIGLSGSEPVSLHWSSLLPNDTTVDGFFDLIFAKSWAHFTQSMSKIVSPSQNFLYADTMNNIGYYAPGRIPVRKQGFSGLFPVAGNGTWDIDEYIPFEQLPHVFNPQKGYIVSANNRVTPAGYPYAFTLDYLPDYRATRIAEMVQQGIIASQGNVTMLAMRLIQLDVRSKLFQTVKFAFEKMKTLSDLPVFQNGLSLLLSWNGDMTITSREAYIFELWLKIMEVVTKHGMYTHL